MKIWKKLMIVLLALGILTGIMGLAMANFDLAKLNSGGEYEQKTFTAEEEIRSLNVAAKNAEIILCAAEEGEPSRVDYEENKTDKYSISLEGGVLSVAAENAAWYRRIFSFRLFIPRVTVYVSESCFESVRLFSNNGGISSEIPLTAETFRAETDNGSVRVSDVGVTGEVFLRTKNGGVAAENISAGSFSAETDNGAVTVKNIVCDGDCSARTNNGRITAEEISCVGFSAETDNGAITAKNVVGVGFYAKTDNGRINATDVEVGEGGTAEMYSDNGDVTAVIRGRQEEFCIRAEAKAGRCNIENSEGPETGGKSLTVKVDCGNVTVSFVD